MSISPPERRVGAAVEIAAPADTDGFDVERRSGCGEVEWGGCGEVESMSEVEWSLWPTPGETVLQKIQINNSRKNPEEVAPPPGPVENSAGGTFCICQFERCSCTPEKLPGKSKSRKYAAAKFAPMARVRPRGGVAGGTCRMTRESSTSSRCEVSW
jgi:hypothetical protein